MCAQCGNKFVPGLPKRGAQQCPATLGSHFPAEVQPFETSEWPADITVHHSALGADQ